MITEENKKDKQNYADVPIYSLKMLTDEEWNRLVYVNWLSRGLEREMIPLNK